MPTYTYDCCGDHMQAMKHMEMCPVCGSMGRRNSDKQIQGMGGFDRVHGRKHSIFGLRNYQDEHLGWVGENKPELMKKKGVRYARGLSSADCYESDPD